MSRRAPRGGPLSTEHAARLAVDRAVSTLGLGVYVFAPHVLASDANVPTTPDPGQAGGQPTRGTADQETSALAAGGLIVEAFLAGISASVRGRLDFWRDGAATWITRRLIATLDRQSTETPLRRGHLDVRDDAVSTVQMAVWDVFAAVEDGRRAGAVAGLAEHVALVRASFTEVLAATGLQRDEAGWYADSVAEAAGPLVGVR